MDFGEDRWSKLHDPARLADAMPAIEYVFDWIGAQKADLWAFPPSIYVVTVHVLFTHCMPSNYATTMRLSTPFLDSPLGCREIQHPAVCLEYVCSIFETHLSREESEDTLSPRDRYCTYVVFITLVVARSTLRKL